MRHELRFTHETAEKLDALRHNAAQKGVFKQVQKTLGYLETNPHHNSLHAHEFHSLTKLYGFKIWEAYVQQKTPGAYRVFFHYGPDERTKSGKRMPIITIISITPHP